MEMMMDQNTEPIPNVELLTKTLAWAEHSATQPWLVGEWHQGVWWSPIETLAETRGYASLPEHHCQTAYCFAGKVVFSNGGEAATFVRGGLAETRVVATEDEVRDGLTINYGDYITPTVTIHDRARRLLGLTDYEADALFNAGNTIEALRRIVGEIVARAERQKAGA